MTDEHKITFRTSDEINKFLEDEAKYIGISKSDLLNRILLSWKLKLKNKSEIDESINERVQESVDKHITILKNEVNVNIDNKINELTNKKIEKEMERTLELFKNVLNELLEEYPTTQELENIENLINNTFVTKGEINELIKKVDRLTSIMDNKQINYEKTKINIQNKSTIIEKEKEAPQRFSFKEDDSLGNKKEAKKENILNELISMNKEKWLSFYSDRLTASSPFYSLLMLLIHPNGTDT